MATTSSAAALLHVAVQDLHAAKVAQMSRLPDLATRCSDPALVALVSAEADRTARQAERIAAAIDVAGPANLWMAGILDDAARDTRQTQPGRLLDIALIGAIRKAKAAEIVSSETAIALARRIEVADLLTLIEANRTAEIKTDHALRDLLMHVVDGCVPSDRRMPRLAG